MNRYFQRYGKAMTAYIFLTTSLWLLGMVLMPQLLMVDYSFWYHDEGVQAIAMKEADRLEAQLDDIDAAITVAESKLDSAVENARPVIETHIAELEAKAGEIGRAHV